MIHVPVMLKESVEALGIVPNGIYVDGTFGRGGHSRDILKHLGPDGRLMVIDKDLTAITEAKKLADNDNRVIVQHGSFAELYNFCDALNWVGKINGILIDLGVSSPQLDDAARGFSFMKEGPLDMRMDTSSGISASEWLKVVEYQELKNILKKYGEEKRAAKIASHILKYRETKEITTTTELADLVASVVPSYGLKKHPATKTFQAIRIFINQELQDLEDCLKSVPHLLTVMGRLVVISFHSLEDRIVKHFMRDLLQVDTFPKDLPIPKSMLPEPKFRLIDKFKLPSTTEVSDNVRARSAKLRVLEKVGEL